MNNFTQVHIYEESLKIYWNYCNRHPFKIIYCFNLPQDIRNWKEVPFILSLSSSLWIEIMKSGEFFLIMFKSRSLDKNKNVWENSWPDSALTNINIDFSILEALIYQKLIEGLMCNNISKSEHFCFRPVFQKRK